MEIEVPGDAGEEAWNEVREHSNETREQLARLLYQYSALCETLFEP